MKESLGMIVDYREARLSDLPKLLEIEQYIIETERPIDPALRRADTRYCDIEALIRQEDACFLVMEKAGEIVASGYAQIRTSEAWYCHDQHAHLGCMYVAEPMRGQGLNQKIIQGLKAWCQAQHIDHLYLEVYAGKENAVHAYQKVGFQPHVLEMRLRLSDDNQ